MDDREDGNVFEGEYEYEDGFTAPAEGFAAPIDAGCSEDAGESADAGAFASDSDAAGAEPASAETGAGAPDGTSLKGEGLRARPIEGDCAGKGNRASSRSGLSAVAPLAGMRVVRVRDFQAPHVMEGAQHAAYVRRFATLFVAQGQARRGGTGRVEHARNAQGEHVALKLPSLPERRDGESLEDYERRVAAARVAFDREYECHLLLSGIKGFPRLYGRGSVDGVPCIVMEWVEGVTLDRARRLLAVDGDGRMGPLAAARIGRDLFDLVARMGYVEGGFVHRDISPRNVMVRTSRLSLAEQVEEGAFDLYLIDFGSSAELDEHSTSFTSANAVFRGATADFAPPEMLTDDIEGLAKLRKSSAIDVYAAASVVHLLACGRPPFDLHAPAQDGLPASPYRLKMAAPAQVAPMAHAFSDVLPDVLAAEPEVAVAVQHAQDKLADPASVAEAAEALSLVDGLLSQVIGDCLARSQDERPAAAPVRDALASFAIHYAENVERSFAGKPLVPCVPGGLATGLLDSRDGTLGRLRLALKIAAGAVLAGVAVSAGVLCNGAAASLSVGDMTWEGGVPGALVAVALAFPAFVGLAVRATGSRTFAGFLRGTAGLVVEAAALFQLLSIASFETPGQSWALTAALVATTAAGWCFLVSDFALNVAIPKVVRRRALPQGPHGEGPLPSGAAGALGTSGAAKASAQGTDGLLGTSRTDDDDGNETEGA